MCFVVHFDCVYCPYSVTNFVGCKNTGQLLYGSNKISNNIGSMGRLGVVIGERIRLDIESNL